VIKVFLYKNRLMRYDLSKLKSVSSLKKNKMLVVVNDPTQDDIKLLEEKFKIHPMTLEDIFSPLTRIKYEEFENNTLIVFKCINKIKKIAISFYTLFFVDGDNYMIVVYYKNNDTIENLINNYNKLESLLKRGEDYVLYYILDKEVDKYLDIKNNLSEHLRYIEEEFLKNPSREVFNKLFLKEKITIEIRQRIDSITDVCARLMKPTENFIQNELIPYFRDVYDHAFKTNEALKTYLERINGIRNTYLSLTSNKMNQTIRILTIIMALIMPMTVLTGFYGMNIKLPIQDNPNAYLILIALIIVILLLMTYLFKNLGWLGNKE